MFLRGEILEKVKDFHVAWRGSVLLHHILVIGTPLGLVLGSRSTSVLIIYYITRLSDLIT